ILIEEREPGVVELLEELVPGDVPELGVLAVPGEVDAEHAGFVGGFGALDGGGDAAALLGPATDLLVISGDVGFLARHGEAPQVCPDMIRAPPEPRTAPALKQDSPACGVGGG